MAVELNVGRALAGELVFDGRSTTTDDEEPIQFTLFGDTGPTQLVVPLSRLHDITSELGERLPLLKDETGKWLSVDEKFAADPAGKF